MICSWLRIEYLQLHMMTTIKLIKTYLKQKTNQIDVNDRFIAHSDQWPQFNDCLQFFWEFVLTADQLRYKRRSRKEQMFEFDTFWVGWMTLRIGCEKRGARCSFKKFGVYETSEQRNGYRTGRIMYSFGEYNIKCKISNFTEAHHQKARRLLSLIYAMNTKTHTKRHGRRWHLAAKP